MCPSVRPLRIDATSAIYPSPDLRIEGVKLESSPVHMYTSLNELKDPDVGPDVKLWFGQG